MYRIKQATQYSNRPLGSPQDWVPAGVTFDGWGMLGWTRINDCPEKWGGKWVEDIYVEEVVVVPDPTDPPVEPPVEPPTVQEVANIHVYEDGSVTVEDFQQG